MMGALVEVPGDLFGQGGMGGGSDGGGGVRFRISSLGFGGV